MNVRRHALTLLAALLVSSVAPKVFAQTKVAVVDLQRALMETEDGRQAKRRLERLFKRRQKTLDAAQSKMKQLKEDIERQQKAGVITDEALQRRLEEYQKAYMELQQDYVQYQRELAAKEAELTSEILERMQAILRRIGQSEGYTLIVEANEGGVVWVPGNLDLTDQLIQRYNSEHGGSSRSSMRRSRRSKMR